MSIVNLNKARKAKKQANKTRQADENAVKFGRTKAQKEVEAAQSAKTVRHLDQHRKE